MDFKDDSPLNKAIENGSINDQKKSSTKLFTFISLGHVRVVELLLYYGANLYTMNISGQMPTDIAHQSGKLHNAHVDINLVAAVKTCFQIDYISLSSPFFPFKKISQSC